MSPILDHSVSDSINIRAGTDGSVIWGAGTITLISDTIYNINSGSFIKPPSAIATSIDEFTGDVIESNSMADERPRYFIFWDVNKTPASGTGDNARYTLSITNNVNNAVGAGKIMLALVKWEVGVPNVSQYHNKESLIIDGGFIGANTITSNHIAANTISATEINAGAIKADKLEAQLALASELVVMTDTSLTPIDEQSRVVISGSTHTNMGTEITRRGIFGYWRDGDGASIEQFRLDSDSGQFIAGGNLIIDGSGMRIVDTGNVPLFQLAIKSSARAGGVDVGVDEAAIGSLILGNNTTNNSIVMTRVNIKLQSSLGGILFNRTNDTTISDLVGQASSDGAYLNTTHSGELYQVNLKRVKEGDDTGIEIDNVGVNIIGTLTVNDIDVGTGAGISWIDFPNNIFPSIALSTPDDPGGGPYLRLGNQTNRWLAVYSDSFSFGEDKDLTVTMNGVLQFNGLDVGVGTSGLFGSAFISTEPDDDEFGTATVRFYVNTSNVRIGTESRPVNHIVVNELTISPNSNIMTSYTISSLKTIIDELGILNSAFTNLDLETPPTNAVNLYVKTSNVNIGTFANPLNDIYIRNITMAPSSNIMDVYTIESLKDSIDELGILNSAFTNLDLETPPTNAVNLYVKTSNVNIGTFANPLNDIYIRNITMAPSSNIMDVYTIESLKDSIDDIFSEISTHIEPIRTETYDLGKIETVTEPGQPNVTVITRWRNLYIENIDLSGTLKRGDLHYLRHSMVTNEESIPSMADGNTLYWWPE